MKDYILSLFFLCFTYVSSGQDTFKTSRKTPEPNTKLSFISWIAVNKINKVIQTNNPDSVFEYYKGRVPDFIMKPGCYMDHKIADSSIFLRIFYPSKRAKKDSKKKDLPVIVFYHGGGFIWGSLDMYHTLAHTLSKKLGCIVVLPEYRLAPEYPYPNALNDCEATLNWVFNHIDQWGGDSSKVGLIGDSAGGNLVLVISLKNNAKLKPYPIRFNVLYYPSTSMLDENFKSRKYFMGDSESGDWYVLNRSLLEQIKKEYLQGESDTLYEISPLYASYNSSYPPTLIVTAQCDPLRDDGEALFSKMYNLGVRVEHIQYRKTIHGFISLYPVLRKGRQAIRKTKNFVKKLYQTD